MWWGSFESFLLFWTGKGKRGCARADLYSPAAGYETATISCGGRTRIPKTEINPPAQYLPFPFPSSPHPAPILWQAVPSPQLHRYLFSISFFLFTNSRHVHVLHHFDAACTPQHGRGRLPHALHRSSLFNAQRHQPERHSWTQCMRRDHGPGIIHPPANSLRQRRCRSVDVHRHRVRKSRDNHGLVPRRWRQ